MFDTTLSSWAAKMIRPMLSSSVISFASSFPPIIKISSGLSLSSSPPSQLPRQAAYRWRHWGRARQWRAGQSWREGVATWHTPEVGLGSRHSVPKTNGYEFLSSPSHYNWATMLRIIANLDIDRIASEFGKLNRQLVYPGWSTWCNWVVLFLIILLHLGGLDCE